MTPTLQDVAYLLGLPIVGEAVGPHVVAASWKDDLEARFALLDGVEKVGPINPVHVSSRSFEDLVPTVYSTHSLYI